jgi:diguanylate cyclase (GGDEF)-like protein
MNLKNNVSKIFIPKRELSALVLIAVLGFVLLALILSNLFSIKNLSTNDLELNKNSALNSIFLYQKLQFFVTIVIIILSGLLIAFINNSHSKVNDFLTKIKDTANHDALTGLPNRRVLDRVVKADVVQAFMDQTLICFVLIDLDHFKLYNDTYGHLAGDDHLKRCAKVWSAQMRADDMLVRMGGEEFGIVLFNCSLQQAVVKVNELQAVMPEKTSFSAGVASWEKDANFEEVYESADRAMYSAKKEGRARVKSA